MSYRYAPTPTGSNKIINCYTDGSAVAHGKNKGLGGFGTYFPDIFGDKKAFSLGFKDTKTGRVELIALLFALVGLRNYIKANVIKEKINLFVYSDSQYVVKSFTEHRLERWISSGWKNSAGDVANKDLWVKILSELYGLNINFNIKHIKAHQVDKEKDECKKQELLKDPHIRGNLIADKLADYKRHHKKLDSDLLIHKMI